MQTHKNTTATTHQPILSGNQPLSHLANALPGLVYAVQLKPEYKVLYLSGSTETLTGCKREMYMGADRENIIRSLVYPEDAQTFTSKLSQLSFSQKETLHTVEYRFNMPDGSLKWVQDQFVGVWDEAGTLIGMEGYISEIPRATLRAQFLSHLVAYRDAINVNMISSMTDARGVISFVNKKFCQISQYTEDELIGQNHNIISSGLHPKSFFVELWKTIASGKVWQGEIVNKAKDGSLYWVDSVIIPIVDEDRKISSYLSLRSLITDRKQAEQQKDRHIQALEHVAYTVAHRFRAPVCSILGLANIIMLAEEQQDKDLMKKIIEHLTKSASELDLFSQELSDKLYAIEMELRNT